MPQPPDQCSAQEERRRKHDRIYMALLIALAFCLILAMGGMFFVMHNPIVKAEDRWVFFLPIYFMACYIAAIALTLIVRTVAPTKARLLTMALNIVLLPYLPFGTAVGIYGLWKVDKKPAPTNSGPT